jgi:phosphoglycerol transferase MdoB-like AlkP superfamily enzyme
MADQSTCMSPLCGISVEGNEKKCPQCGWAMRGTRNIRIRGWVLLVCGLFLVLFMGAITWNMLPMLLRPEQAIAAGTFTGTPDQARTFLNLFLLVILFGALGTVNALYMISTGSQNRWFVIGTLVLAAILYGFAYSIIHASK